jgi:hypothetical protein
MKSSQFFEQLLYQVGIPDGKVVFLLRVFHGVEKGKFILSPFPFRNLSNKIKPTPFFISQPFQSKGDVLSVGVTPGFSGPSVVE